MSFSLRVLVPGMIAVLILAGGIVLVLVASYLSYQNVLEEIVKERSVDLKVIKNTLYSEFFYYRGLILQPETKRVFIKEMATAPGVVFLRIIQPRTGKVLVSSKEEEIGQIFEQLPPFPLEPFVAQGKWQGEKILEISMQGAATENLWMGVALKPIQQAALKIAFQTGLLVFLFTIIVGGILYFAIQKIILSPLMAIFQGIEKIRRGNLETRVDLKSKTELGDLATAFNEMTRDLRESRAALEEAKNVLEIKVAARTKELRELAAGLEDEVKRRTAEVQERMKELERFHRLAVGRELKMIELKKALREAKEEIEKLKKINKND